MKMNRILMNMLNKTTFKCQFKGCNVVVPYEKYGQHILTCEEKKKQCNNKYCANRIQEQEDLITNLQMALAEKEETRVKQLQAQKNQFIEFKQQLLDKFKGKDVDGDGDSPTKKNMDRIEDLQLKLAASESKVHALNQENSYLR